MKVTQTFKNLNRLRRIGAVFASHGFMDVAQKIGLGWLVPSVTTPEGKTKLSAPERMRLAFEELGPTFVKLGQMLSIRPDLVPTEFANEFRKLQDHVPPFSFEELSQQVEKDLEVPLTRLFAWFDPEPLGAASIAQAHRARCFDGREIVVKVRRPGIEQLIETDLSILFTLAQLIETYLENPPVRPTEIVDEFSRLIRNELDFMREAQNISRFHKNFEEDPRVVIPKVCWECSGRRVLAMTYLKGVPLNDMERLKETGWDLKKFGRTGVDAFLKMVFVHGYFHGDIHGGNVLAMAEEQIGLIDFGVVGQLDRRLLEDASGLFIALVQRDWRAVARAYVRISSFAGDTAAIDRFARDLSDVLDPLMGLSLKQIDSARVLVQLLEVANRHHVRVPQDLLLLFRALASLDTIGRELDPDFDVVSAATPFAKDLLTDRFRPERLTIDLVSALRDLADMGRDLPAQMQNIVRRVDQGSLTIEARVKDPRMMQIVRREGWRVSSALLTGSGGVMLALTQAQESLGVGGWLGLTFVIAGLLGFWVTVLQRRK